MDNILYLSVDVFHRVSFYHSCREGGRKGEREGGGGRREREGERGREGERERERGGGGGGGERGERESSHNVATI